MVIKLLFKLITQKRHVRLYERRSTVAIFCFTYLLFIFFTLTYSSYTLSLVSAYCFFLQKKVESILHSEYIRNTIAPLNIPHGN